MVGLTDTEQSRTSARTPLPEGTIPVAIGLFIAGVCSFAFFRVGKDALGSEEAFKPVVSLWFATFALAPGFFLPLEQELGRALSARRALGQGGRPVAMKVLTLGAILATHRDRRDPRARTVAERRVLRRRAGSWSPRWWCRSCRYAPAHLVARPVQRHGPLPRLRRGDGRRRAGAHRCSACCSRSSASRPSGGTASRWRSRR